MRRGIPLYKDKVAPMTQSVYKAAPLPKQREKWPHGDRTYIVDYQTGRDAT